MNTTFSESPEKVELSSEILELKSRAFMFDPLEDATVDQLEQLLEIIDDELRKDARERRFRDGLIATNVFRHVMKKPSITAKTTSKNDVKINVNFGHGETVSVNINVVKPKTSGQIEFTSPSDIKSWIQRCLADFDRDTKKKLREIQQAQRKAEQDLHSTQQEELENLEKLWNSKQKRRLYNRPSYRLSELNRQLNIALTETKFGEAETLRKQIEVLKKEESEEAFRKMQRDFDEATENLKKKLNQDFLFFVESNKVKEERFRQKRERERRAIEFRELRMQRNRESKLNAAAAAAASTNVNNDVVNPVDDDGLNNGSTKIVIKAKKSANDRGSVMRHSKKLSIKDVENKEEELLELPPLVSKRKMLVTTNNQTESC